MTSETGNWLLKLSGLDQGHTQKDRPSYRVDLGNSLSLTFWGHIAA